MRLTWRAKAIRRLMRYENAAHWTIRGIVCALITALGVDLLGRGLNPSFVLIGTNILLFCFFLSGWGEEETEDQ